MSRKVIATLTAAIVLATAFVERLAAGETPATFTWRGVIEGFYGPPWPAENRIAFLQWMASKGMNLYIHAPKNDPYQRLQWRTSYPQDEIDQFELEVAAVDGSIEWVPSISPGFPLLEAADDHQEDICFSCDEDFGVLTTKLDQFWDIGVRTLMISFDDVIKISSHPEDAAAFGVGDYAYGVMNGVLLNAIHDHYSQKTPGGDSFRLITVPADYFGVSTTPYLEGLSSVLHEEVIVMWTGVLVVSPTISCLEANGYAAAFDGNPLLLWDNFPVNDYAPYKLMVGPYAGRAPDLPTCLSGIAVNPANQVVANEIPLATVADYLIDPASYAKEASWQASIDDFGGGKAAHVRRFVENVRSTALDRTESVRFTELRNAFLLSQTTQDWPIAHRAFTRELRDEARTEKALRKAAKGDAHLADFVEELDCELPFQAAERNCDAGSWLEQFTANARGAVDATALLARIRPDVEATLSGQTLTGFASPPAGHEETAAAIAALAAAASADPDPRLNVHGDRFYFALGPVYANENRLDEYRLLALGRLLAYAPTAPLASSGVTVTVDGDAVALGDDGSFSVTIYGSSAEVVVTDGAGRRTRRFFGK